MCGKEIARQLEKQAGAFLGAAVYAVGVNLFIVPAGLYSGGVMGICQLLRNLFFAVTGFTFANTDVAGIIYYLINIPVFLVGIRVLGKRFMASTILTVTVMSFLLSVIPIFDTPLMEADIFASSVIGGVLAGAGIGMVLRESSTMGGMDIVSLFIMRRHQNVSMGKVYLAVNILVYGICMILYSPRIAVYSLVYAVVSSSVMDRVHTQKINMVAWIVCREHVEELRYAIMEELGRGATYWKGGGAYTGNEETVLMTALSKYELPLLRQLVHDKEPGAFVIIGKEVLVDGNYQSKL
ncbi:MAG: YitT family protein [Roseburia sp.]